MHHETFDAAGARLRALAAAQGLLIFRLSSDGLMLSAPGWEDVTGQSPDEYLGVRLFDAIHPEDVKRVQAVRRNCLARGEAGDCQYRLRRQSGEWRWVRCQMSPVRRPGGGIAEWVGSIVDIHDHKLIEEQLRGLEEQLARSLATTGSDSVAAPAPVPTLELA